MKTYNTKLNANDKKTHNDNKTLCRQQYKY